MKVSSGEVKRVFSEFSREVATGAGGRVRVLPEKSRELAGDCTGTVDPDPDPSKTKVLEHSRQEFIECLG